jgi:hypothetical protein
MHHYLNAENESSNGLPTDFYAPSFQNISNVLKAVFRLYRNNFVLIFKIVSVLTVPLIIAQYAFLSPFAFSFVGIASWLLKLAGEALLSTALIYAVVIFLRTGADPTIADSYRWGFKKWGRVILCIISFNVITALGYVALIIPGIIWSLMYALVIPVVVIEDKLVMDSFNRSRDLTKNYRGQIFLTQFLFGIIIFGATFITTHSLSGKQGVESSFLFVVAQGLTAQLLKSSYTMLSLFIYLGILSDLKQLPARDRDDLSLSIVQS